MTANKNNLWQERETTDVALLTTKAYVAADFFPFLGRDWTSERKSGRAKEHTSGEQKIGEK